MPVQPTVLARGPWSPDAVDVRWTEHEYQAPAEAERAADAAIAALRERGSPSHDGLAARLARHSESHGRLELELQPARWALRLVEHHASRSLSALCVARDGDGRWLAGRRAAWLSSWAGRWALGAGGSVDLGENPVETLARELHEEWALTPDRIRIETLLTLSSGMVMLIGQAWIEGSADVRLNDEHDDYAWWPADIRRWPAEASEPLRALATMLDS